MNRSAVPDHPGEPGVVAWSRLQARGRAFWGLPGRGRGDRAVRARRRPHPVRRHAERLRQRIREA